MQRIGTIPVISIAFLVGCATASVVKLEVPTARADAGLTRWEYYCVNMTEGVTEYSNKLGADGWQMVTAGAYVSSLGGTTGNATMIWCYQRPLASR